MNAKEFIKRMNETEQNNIIIWDEREPPVFDNKSFYALKVKEIYENIRKRRMRLK